MHHSKKHAGRQSKGWFLGDSINEHRGTDQTNFNEPNDDDVEGNHSHGEGEATDLEEAADDYVEDQGYDAADKDKDGLHHIKDSVS